MVPFSLLACLLLSLACVGEALARDPAPVAVPAVAAGPVNGSAIPASALESFSGSPPRTPAVGSTRDVPPRATAVLPADNAPPRATAVAPPDAAPRRATAIAAPAGTPPRAIWTGVVLATNEPQSAAKPPPHPGPLERYREKLKNIFGYNHFELIGQATQRIDETAEHWLVPTKDFRLNLHPHRVTDRNRVRMVLFQRRHRVAEFETPYGEENALFIRGPQYARGQLILVVHGAPAESPPIRGR